MLSRVVLASVLAFLLSCHESPTAPGGLVAFTTIVKEQQTGLTAPRAELVTTQVRWNAVWSEIVSNRTPKPAAPSVDFSTSAVIVIARGETGDSCRTIEIERVEAHNGTYEVAVNDLRPPMSCSCPAVSVRPVHAVSVPRVATEVAATYRAVTVGPGCN